RIACLLARACELMKRSKQTAVAVLLFEIKHPTGLCICLRHHYPHCTVSIARATGGPQSPGSLPGHAPLTRLTVVLPPLGRRAPWYWPSESCRLAWSHRPRAAVRAPPLCPGRSRATGCGGHG